MGPPQKGQNKHRSKSKAQVQSKIIYDYSDKR